MSITSYMFSIGIIEIARSRRVFVKRKNYLVHVSLIRFLLSEIRKHRHGKIINPLDK